ncbi:MAG: ABC transporter substrate binding protein [Candidatus Kryptonium sp.]
MRKAIFLLVLFQSLVFAQKGTPLQYLYLMKSFKPEIQKVGVICDLSKNRGIVEKFQRPAFSVGVKIVVVDVRELKDVSRGFEELVNNGVDFIWIFDNEDVSAHPIAREYIFKNALLKKIPVAVSNLEFVKEGALFSLEILGEEVKVYVNNKVANALQLTVPENYKERVQYVAN